MSPDGWDAAGIRASAKKPSSAATDPLIRAWFCGGSGAGRPREGKNQGNALMLFLVGPSACAGIEARCGEIPSPGLTQLPPQDAANLTALTPRLNSFPCTKGGLGATPNSAGGSTQAGQRPSEQACAALPSGLFA